MPLEPGLEAAFQYAVTGADTAAALGGGEMPVLVTPRVLALPERVTVAAVAGALEVGATVGTRPVSSIAARGLSCLGLDVHRDTIWVAGLTESTETISGVGRAPHRGRARGRAPVGNALLGAVAGGVLLHLSIPPCPIDSAASGRHTKRRRRGSPTFIGVPGSPALPTWPHLVRVDALPQTVRNRTEEGGSCRSTPGSSAIASATS
jgi:hypothetical protein